MREKDDFDNGGTFRHFYSLYTSSSSAGCQSALWCHQQKKQCSRYRSIFNCWRRIMRKQEAQVSRSLILEYKQLSAPTGRQQKLNLQDKTNFRLKDQWYKLKNLHFVYTLVTLLFLPCFFLSHSSREELQGIGLCICYTAAEIWTPL